MIAYLGIRIRIEVVAGMLVGAGLIAFAPRASAQCCGEWQSVTPNGPSSRINAAMVYDSARDVVVLFGGSASRFGGEFGDTWEWDGVDWRLVALAGPPARARHSMVYDSVRAVTVLFGGRRPYSDVYEDTWEWDGREWTRVDNDGPRSAYNHVMVFDEARNETILFVSGETYGWNGSTWSTRSTEGPSGRTLAGMIYDGVRQVSVLFGGYNDFPNRLADTWEWDGAHWTRVSLSGPDARSSHAMAFNPVRGETLLFGGEAYQRTFGDTWAFRGCSGSIHMTPRYSGCPNGGTGAVAWACASPGGEVQLLYAAGTGNMIIPTGPCAGVRLGLGRNRLQLVESGMSDAVGRGEIIVQHGRRACGGAIQLLDIESCSVSNVAIVE